MARQPNLLPQWGVIPMQACPGPREEAPPKRPVTQSQMLAVMKRGARRKGKP